MAGIQTLGRVSYIAMGWLAYRGARALHHLSACDLEASREAINLFMNLEGCQIGVADSGKNGGPNPGIGTGAQ